jgi:hypothetical protein
MSVMGALVLCSLVIGLDDASERLWRGTVTLAAWGFVEWRWRERPQGLTQAASGIIRWHRAVFASIALIITMGTGIRLAFALTWIGPEWAPIARRGVGVVAGGALAVWGNYLPKLLSPWHAEDEPFDWRRVHRFVGWVVSIGGVALMLAWTVLPIDQARYWSGRIMLACALLALARKAYSLATYSGPRDGAESGPSGFPMERER